MKLIYKPFGIVAGILAGVLARKLFAALWDKLDGDEPPRAKTELASWSRVVAAAGLQGLTFAVVKAVVDRAGARGFEHLFGVWPGDKATKKA